VNPPPITACLGLDQAASTGWAIGVLSPTPTIVCHGVAKDADERRRVVELALGLAGGTDAWGRAVPAPRQLLVMLEQHDHMALDRLTRNDRRTKRQGPHFVQRGPKQVHGMGKAYGRWEERLDDVRHPDCLRDEAEPRTWRARVLGNQWASKEDAVRWAAAYTREDLANADEAEGIGLCAFAMHDGVARLEARRRTARLYARGKREERRQLELGAVGPKEASR
jgi:hypothetical protein